uniref:hypothetical protein n=1 Tax=Candidatus Cryptobacteroides bacterium TaxID=3085639 RepID=UPI003FED9857
DYIKNCKAEICLARTVRAIDDTILDNTILYGKSIERIVAVAGQINFYPIFEPSEISYGKLCKHIISILVSATNIMIFQNIRKKITDKIQHF